MGIRDSVAPWRGAERQVMNRGALMAPDRVAAEGFKAEDMGTVEAMRRKAFVGDAPGVASRLRALAAELQLDELVINTWAHGPTVRRDSYALLAQAFALPASPSQDRP